MILVDTGMPAETPVTAPNENAPIYMGERISDYVTALEGVYFIQAKGHTNGNSIIIAKNNGLFYMMYGDVTYTDEAIYANKLSSPLYLKMSKKLVQRLTT